MTSQSLTTALLPPAPPTLDLGLPTGNYTASGFTKFAQNAIVTGDTTDKILGLQVRIETGNGTLGVVDGTALSASGTSGKIKYEYLAGTRLLRLTDISGDLSAIGSDFQTVLRNVAIQGATGSVSISANLGKPVYRSANGNYYEFVTSGAGSAAGQLTTWTQANAGATASTFLGLQGYLATITSAGENQFLTSTFDSRGWIGGRAAVVNNVRTWTWVGGPEANKSFWTGDASSGTSTGTDIGYANWATGEPNNFLPDSPGGLGEPYAQFTADGKWNDLADDPSYQPVGEGNSPYRPNGYWVEYGLGTGSASLAGTRDTIALNEGTVNTTTPLDLVFFDPTKGQVSFAFTGSTFSTIAIEGLTSDTPVLTRNSNSATPQFGTDWRLVSAGVDVDKDNVKDLIFANTINNSVAVLFGEARTGTDRQFAYRNSAFAQLNGTTISPGLDWTLEFASSKIGANNEAGVFWRSKAGGTAIWSLTAATAANGEKSVALTNSGIIAGVGANSGWRAIGDGEFNANTTTREVFWVNDINGSVATWSLTANRTSRTSKFAWTGTVPTSDWNVVGIGNIGGVVGANDNIVWQRKSGSVMVNWTMVDGERSILAGPPAVITLTAADRIKALADVDGDGVLDLIGQFDGNGTIAAYALTSTFALKNPSAARTQYTSNNAAGYRPGKGGPNNANLELVNVAQYNSVA